MHKEDITQMQYWLGARNGPLTVCYWNRTWVGGCEVENQKSNLLNGSNIGLHSTYSSRIGPYGPYQNYIIYHSLDLRLIGRWWAVWLPEISGLKNRSFPSAVGSSSIRHPLPLPDCVLLCSVSRWCRLTVEVTGLPKLILLAICGWCRLLKMIDQARTRLKDGWCLTKVMLVRG